VSRRRKYQLLRQLTAMQLLAVVVGLLGLGGAYFFITRDTFKQAVQNERLKVALSLREQQEKWRTWKQVGLDEALSKDLASHSKVFSLSELSVKRLSQVRLPLSQEEIVIPEVGTVSPETEVVYAKLNSDHIEAAYVPYRSNLLLLVLSGGLFCFVILLSARFVRKNIYLPFLELQKVFEACNAGQEVSEKGIVASGEIREFISNLIALYRKLQENEKNSAIFAVARQVAHDIRSPLAALDMILDTLPQLPEQKRLIIRGALGRIRDIANDVLERSRRNQGGLVPAPLVEGKREERVSVQCVASLVEEILTEKRILVRSTPEKVLEAQIAEHAYGLFARVQPGVLKTVLSNLVNNALEALETSGKVSLSLESQGNELLVKVVDNGRGMSAEVLQSVRSVGGSFGKSTGQGLGLTHARSCLARWGGALHIQSIECEGTEVRVVLPSVAPPRWFVPKIEVSAQQNVVILDDDPSIHLVWQTRFGDVCKNANTFVSLEHFSDTQSLRRWCAENPLRVANALFLCDYEILGADQNGIELIQSLGIADRAILVTGRYDEESIRARCESMNLRLLPKGLGGCVPVEVVARKERIDAVLLDDDPLVHMSWELSARSHYKNLKSYHQVEALWEALSDFDPAVPFYLDYHLSGDETGVDVARRLKKAGYTNVYIASGHEDLDLGQVEDVKGIRGKTPPWATHSAHV
jgi:signal transduction histidine kinase